MTSAGMQERLKEEAKSIHHRIESLIKEQDPQARMLRTFCIYAGMLTETLLEYEEPDVVMEHAFHRIADLTQIEPTDGPADPALMPRADVIDHDSELGRLLTRQSAEKLPKGFDDMHEIAIGMIINELASWQKEGFQQDVLLRLLIEMVIACLTFEMATQDFCDTLIEDFMTEGHSIADALMGLSIVAGHYFQHAAAELNLPPAMQENLINVMVRESLRHETPGTKNWANLAAANDTNDGKIPEYLNAIKPHVEDFFVLIGLDDPLGRAVSVAKAVGRMVAVISVEDVGQIHPTVAKSLAKTGVILGINYKEKAVTA